MKRFQWLIAAGFWCPVVGSSLFAGDFSFSGYLRSGIGGTTHGADQRCFGAEGSSMKFRLGNECDTYAEAALAHTTEGQPVNFRTQLRLALITQSHRSFESTKTSAVTLGTSTSTTLVSPLTIALPEAFAETVHPGHMTYWVGKRYYRRQDIHIVDFYYLNNSGPGLGVENVDLAFAKAHIAVIRNVPSPDLPDVTNGPVQTNLDLRLSDIALGSSLLETVLIHGTTTASGHGGGPEVWEPMQGSQVGLIWTQSLDDMNFKVGAQYGMGLFGGRVSESNRSASLDAFGGWGEQNIAKSDTASRDARRKSSTWRIFTDNVLTFTPSVDLNVVALHQNTEFGKALDTLGNEAPAKAETQIGGRLLYQLTAPWAIAAEVGTSKVCKARWDIDDKTYKDSQLHKFTLAPQVSPGSGFFGRPNLRVFATYAMWDKESEGKTDTGRSGFSVGGQVESWW